MASLARSVASTITNRSYNNVPASASALRHIFHVSSNQDDEHHSTHVTKSSSSIKQRSPGGLINNSYVNGKTKNIATT
jgi:ubiquinol-cytochrome c reductase iron-sulfur subunit